MDFSFLNLLSAEEARLIFQLLDVAGVALFALTGALVASRLQLDVISFCFFASFAGLGGGTLRDLILDAPVFWLHSPVYLSVCVAMALICYIIAPMLESRYKLILWADAIGLCAFALVGTSKALGFEVFPLVAVGLGAITATFGGLIRDVVAQEPSVMLRRELYVTPAVVAASVFVICLSLGATQNLSAVVGFALGFGLRAGSLIYGWQLPGYKSRPGRHPDDIV
jgi:uncharacterized membrane protein YeiH